MCITAGRAHLSHITESVDSLGGRCPLMDADLTTQTADITTQASPVQDTASPISALAKMRTSEPQRNRPAKHRNKHRRALAIPGNARIDGRNLQILKSGKTALEQPAPHPNKKAETGREVHGDPAKFSTLSTELARATFILTGYRETAAVGVKARSDSWEGPAGRCVRKR